MLRTEGPHTTSAQAFADGVFQLYVELPYHHYLEIDSLTFNGTVGTPSAKAWADVV